MTLIERLVFNELQKGIPFVERPFNVIGEKLGISEDEVISIIQSLKSKDYIRRFGGIVDVNKLGIKSTLVAMKVEQNEVERVASIISGYNGVTHNYEREDAYNLWFTLMEPTEEELVAKLNEIKIRTNVNEMISLPAVNKYKTNVYFNFV